MPVPGEPTAASGVVTYYPVRGEGASIRGVVSVGFRPERLIAAIADGKAGLWVRIVDPTRALPPRALYQGSSSGAWTNRVDADAVPQGTVRRFDARLATLPLQVTLTPGEALLADRGNYLPWLAGFGGLLVTLLGGAYLATQARRAQHIERQVSRGTRALLEAQSELVRNAEARERTLQALRESEARYRLLADNATDVISRLAPDGTVRYVSPAVRHILGYEPEALVGRSVYELLPAIDVAEVRRQTEQALRQGGVHTVAYRLQDARGQIVWLEAIHRILTDPHTGRPSEVISVSRDISDRKRAEEQLAQISRQHDLILNAAAEGIYGVDMDGYTTFVNQAAARMLGYRAEELVGIRMHSVLQGGGQASRWEDSRIYASIEDQRTYHVDSDYFRDRENRPLHVQYVVSPIIENERSTGAVVVFSPVAEWRRPAASANGAD